MVRLGGRDTPPLPLPSGIIIAQITIEGKKQS
jgi:hypothetical protein